MPVPRRRAVLSLGLLLLDRLTGRSAAFAKASPPASAGVAFSARSGVNVVALGFDIYQPVTVQTWDTTLPDTRLAGLRAAGFDHIRIAYDPSPALAAASPAALDDALGPAKHAIDAAIRCGLKVILDLHVATQGAWSTAAIEADYPSGPKWRRYIDVAVRFAQLCAGYKAADVAFELYNENSNNESFGNSAWAVRVQALWAAVRAANRKTTLLVGGSFYSSIEGLRDLRASSFDANTGFVVHNYNPTIFTHQNAASYTRYVQRLHYPPVPSERQAALDSVAALIGASDLAPADKQRAQTDRWRRLNTYFDTPQGPDYVLSKVKEIAAWQRRNTVSSARIFVTEFGTHNDHDFIGAALIARLAWTQDVDGAHQAAGYCRSVWNYNSPDYWDITRDDGSWRIRDSFLVALGHGPASDLEPEAQALLEGAAAPLHEHDRALVNELVRQLKDHGLWTKLDALYVFAGPEGVATEWKGAAAGQTGNTARAQPSAVLLSVDVGGQTPVRDGHVGVFASGEASQRKVAVDCGDNRLLQIDPVSGASSGPSSDAPRGDAAVLHALVSTLRGPDATLYANGSQVGPAAAIPPSMPAAARLVLTAANRASCAVVHSGDVLSAEQARDLFTLLRFYVNGRARIAASS